MDATRVMTTAALSVAMATLFAPPVVGWMAAPADRPARHLEIIPLAPVSTLPQGRAVGRLAMAAEPVACEQPSVADARLASLPRL